MKAVWLACATPWTSGVCGAPGARSFTMTFTPDVLFGEMMVATVELPAGFDSLAAPVPCASISAVTMYEPGERPRIVYNVPTEAGADGRVMPAEALQPVQLLGTA